MADTLGEQNIRITTSGVMAAERQLNSLGRGMSKVENLARLIATGGALSIGGILHQAMSGTAEGDRFQKALENLTRTLGDQFAPWVRSATRLMNEWAAAYRALSPETQAAAARIAIFTAAVVALGAILPTVIRGIAGLITVMRLAAGINFLAAAGSAGPTIAAIAAVTAAGVYMYEIFTAKATELSKTQFEITRGWVLTVGTIMNKLGVLSDKDMGFINARIGREQEARRVNAEEKAKEAAEAAKRVAGGAGAGRDLRGFTPFIHPEFQSPQAGWERLMKGLAANDPLADIGKAQLGKLQDIDDKLGAGLGAVEKLDDMIPAVR